MNYEDYANYDFEDENNATQPLSPSVKPFYTAEFSNTGILTYCTNEDGAVLPNFADKTFYFRVQVELPELSKMILLFFNERIIASEVIQFVTKVEFPQSSDDFGLFLQDGELIPPPNQISSYLQFEHSITNNEEETENITLVLKTIKTIVPAIRAHKTRSNSPLNLYDSLNYSSTESLINNNSSEIDTSTLNILSPSIKTKNLSRVSSLKDLPDQLSEEISSQLTNSSIDHLQSTNVMSQDSQNNTSDPSLSQPSLSSPTMNNLPQILRNFYVLFPTTKRKRSAIYVMLFLDLNQSVSENLQKAIEYAKFDEINAADYGLFCPSPFAKEIVVTNSSHFNEAEILQQLKDDDEDGFWLQKNLPLSTALNQRLSQPFLEIRQYKSPKYVSFCQIDPSTLSNHDSSNSSIHNNISSNNNISYNNVNNNSGNNNEIIGIIQIKTKEESHMETFLLLYTMQMTSFSAISYLHKYLSQKNKKYAKTNINYYRLFDAAKEKILESSINLFSYLKSNSLSELKLINITDDEPLQPLQEPILDYGQINSSVLNMTSPLSESEINAEKGVLNALAKFEETYQKPELIGGEYIRKSFDNIFCFLPRVGKKKGIVFITNYQLCFLGYDRSTYFSRTADCYIPLTSILKVIEIGREGELLGIQINCKDFRTLTFGTEGNPKQAKMLMTYLATPPPFTKLFAFENKEFQNAMRTHVNGWELYCPKTEYQRLGLSSSHGWRMTFVNTNYAMCESYPSTFIVPECIDDDTIIKVAQFRSKGRVLATVWRHPNGATITRCSQPRVGFLRKSRCDSDEKLVQEIRETSPSNGSIYLLDSRPIANAKANHLRKGGHESTSIYTDCKLLFLNIVNIHAVYDSFMKMNEICQYNSSQERWLSSLEATNWLQIISTVIAAAVKIAVIIDKKNLSIITHCSDGWDRTSQISALSQFLLDPFYRTIYGFAILIEKEWCSFGHRFALRCGHQSTSIEEVSPIFLVFIDSIYQVMVQFPCSVEFNEKLLLFIIDNVYSCRFGTFLCDSEKERKERKVMEKTISIWSIVNERRDDFLNVMYRNNMQVLYPSFSMRKLQVWTAYYLRWITSSHPKESLETITKATLLELSSLRKQIKIYQSAANLDS